MKKTPRGLILLIIIALFAICIASVDELEKLLPQYPVRAIAPFVTAILASAIIVFAWRIPKREEQKYETSIKPTMLPSELPPPPRLDFFDEPVPEFSMENFTPNPDYRYAQTENQDSPIHITPMTDKTVQQGMPGEMFPAEIPKPDRRLYADIYSFVISGPKRIEEIEAKFRTWNRKYTSHESPTGIHFVVNDIGNNYTFRIPVAGEFQYAAGSTVAPKPEPNTKWVLRDAAKGETVTHQQADSVRPTPTPGWAGDDATPKRSSWND